MKTTGYLELMNRTMLQPTFQEFIESNQDDVKEMKKVVVFKLFYDKIHSYENYRYVCHHEELIDILRNPFSYGFEKYNN